MDKRIYLLIMTLFTVLLTYSYCNISKAEAQENSKATNVYDEEKDYIQGVRQEKIIIPNIKGTYSFLYISDTHIIIKNRDDLGCMGKTDDRINSLKNSKRKTSAEQFPYWIQFANQNNVNALLMGGDIIDYLSDENVNYIKNSLSYLNSQYLYTMGNHDPFVPWNKDKDIFRDNDKNLLGLFKNQDTELQILDCGEFNIISINDSMGKISYKALSEFKYRTVFYMMLIGHNLFKINKGQTLIR